MASHLLHGTPVENTVGEYLTNVRIQEAAYESHARGQRIALHGYDPPPRPAPLFT